MAQRQNAAIGTKGSDFMAVNIASRLQSLAQGNEILLDEYTMEKVGNEIQATPLPAVSVKGLDTPIPIFSIKIG